MFTKTRRQDLMKINSLRNAIKIVPNFSWQILWCYQRCWTQCTMCTYRRSSPGRTRTWRSPPGPNTGLSVYKSLNLSVSLMTRPSAEDADLNDMLRLLLHIFWEWTRLYSKYMILRNSLIWRKFVRSNSNAQSLCWYLYFAIHYSNALLQIN